MFRKLIATAADDYGMLIVRVALAGVMLPHGAQKVFGWFGGHGFANTVAFFASQGIPRPLAVLVILAESLGALALLAGLLGRVGAFGIAAVMAGAIAMVHGQFGFFMNWSGQQPGEGFEYHLLALGMAVAVILRGSGALSVDRLLQRKLDEQPATRRGFAPVTA